MKRERLRMTFFCLPLRRPLAVLIALTAVLLAAAGGCWYWWRVRYVAPCPSSVPLLLRTAKTAGKEHSGSISCGTLTALGSYAASGVLYKKSRQPRSVHAVYRFTPEQRGLLAERLRDGPVSLAVSVSAHGISVPAAPAAENAADGTLRGTPQGVFSFSLLYDDDFSESDGFSLHQYRADHACARVPYNLLAESAGSGGSAGVPFTVSIAAAEMVPAGILIENGGVRVMLDSLFEVPLKIGWDRQNLFFAFCTGGGTACYDSVDFSDGGAVFGRGDAAAGPASAEMPHMIMELYPCDDIGTWRNQAKVAFTVGEEELSARRVLGQTVQRVVIPAAALSEPFSPVKFTLRQEMVSSVFMVPPPAELSSRTGSLVTVPYECDPGLMLGWKSSRWRTPEYELFRWPQFPDVLFIDTRDYGVQDAFFRRLAFFVEKKGYKGKLRTDQDMAGLHGYNAHDYKADDLARFFTTAAEQSFMLGSREYMLLEILLANGIVVRDGERFRAGRGCIISISQESEPWRRYMLLAHEGWHGIYFSSAEFRTQVSAVYRSTEREAVAFLKRYWESQRLNYDTDDQMLVENEFMAYLLQQPVYKTAEYYVQRSAWRSVIPAAGRLSTYVQKTGGSAFVRAAEQLNAYAFDTWGLAGGRVSLVNR